MKRLKLLGLLAASTALGCASDSVTSVDTTGAATQGTDTLSTANSAGINTSAGNGCGNNIIDGDDLCDGTDLAGNTCQSLGFQTGELGCTGNCGGFDLTGCGFFICGDGSQDGAEDCDGTVGDATCSSIGEGFDNGTLFCTNKCEYDTSNCGICGNGAIDSGEDCDIKDDLPASCSSLGFTMGTLQCGPDCMFNIDSCTTCGDNTAEGNEECDGTDDPGMSCTDLGFSGGPKVLPCNNNTCRYDSADCSICGNEIIEAGEVCDEWDTGIETCQSQGFSDGWLGCGFDCQSFSTIECWDCGDGILSDFEDCDGDLLPAWALTCVDLGFDSGVLTCAAGCFLDTSQCEGGGFIGTDGGDTEGGSEGWGGSGWGTGVVVEPPPTGGPPP